MLCEGRAVIVTGAGRGLGRAHALAFAAEGASVIVNDVDIEPAAETVADIEAAGGIAIANSDDVSTWEGAHRLVHAAIDTWGHVDTVVNNAGIVRDRMLVNMSVDEWDAVMRVHLKATLSTARAAAAHWRDRI